jgi:hypothetical protein
MIRHGAPCPREGCRGVLELVSYLPDPRHVEHACPRCRRGWVNGEPRKGVLP